MDISHIVTVGCSFTYCQGLDNMVETGWPALVAKHFNSQLTNLAMPGIGNDAIHRRTSEYICENLKFHDSKPLVIIAWSQIERQEQWYNDRLGDPMFEDYYLVSKPQRILNEDPYENVYLYHYNERNFYRKTLLYKLSLISLLTSLGIPYMMSDFMYMEHNAYTDRVEKEFGGMVKKINEDPFRIRDIGEITKWEPKLPCGHDTAENMVLLSNFIIDNINRLYPDINFKNDIPHLTLTDFIKTSKYNKKFPEWCHFTL